MKQTVFLLVIGAIAFTALVITSSCSTGKCEKFDDNGTCVSKLDKKDAWLNRR